MDLNSGTKLLCYAKLKTKPVPKCISGLWRRNIGGAKSYGIKIDLNLSARTKTFQRKSRKISREKNCGRSLANKEAQEK